MSEHPAATTRHLVAPPEPARTVAAGHRKPLHYITDADNRYQPHTILIGHDADTREAGQP